MNKQPAKNEGEGNKTADREYRQGATHHAESGRSEEKAREAEAAIDGDESEELEEAEQAGKSKR
jgi:hypothetical protein